MGQIAQGKRKPLLDDSIIYVGSKTGPNICRYESEEDDFVRELEEMRRNLQGKEEEVPQDPAPILSTFSVAEPQRS